jgi:membrane fusion protein (multidrug efflux system)
MKIEKRNPRKKALTQYAIAVGLLGGLALAYNSYSHWHSVATDDAYTAVDSAQISAATSGIVLLVHKRDTETVRQGDVLVELDHADAKLKLQETESRISAGNAELQRTTLEWERRNNIKDSGSVSEEELTKARYAMDMAKANLETYKAQKSQAQLDLARTTITAPIGGVIAKRQVQVGQRISAGTLLLTIVPIDQIHVDANFKENQLDGIATGQKAIVKADVYGSSVTYHGTVSGFSAGTGSAFAAIPAQNATGNWIKVVQRVPVRIELNPEELSQNPLRVGLSMTVDIEKN